MRQPRALTAAAPGDVAIAAYERAAQLTVDPQARALRLAAGAQVAFQVGRFRGQPAALSGRSRPRAGQRLTCSRRCSVPRFSRADGLVRRQSSEIATVAGELAA